MKANHRRVSSIGWRLAFVGIGLAIGLSTPMPARAATCSGFCYAGEQSSSTGPFEDGIDGYIRQSATQALQPGQVHFDWIGVCSATLCGNTWVQIGESQGLFATTGAYIYTEFQDACGRQPPKPNWGAAPANQAYYVTFDGNSYSEYCPSGTPNAGQQVWEYEYQFAKGSVTSNFAVGYMAAAVGIFSARTELQPNNDTPMGYDFFGCSGQNACSNAGYGLHYHNSNSGWTLWTGNGGAFPSNNPPWFLTKNPNWSFETCRTNGCV